MKKFFLQAIILLIVIFGALFFFFNGSKNIRVSNPQPVTLPQNTLTIRGITLKVEIADTPEKRRQGLGGRQSLASDSGMLFIFPQEGTQTFWMKGLKFPLDFIWIRSNKVVDITKNVPPPAPNTNDRDLPIYIPREPVTKVLEVNGGFADRFGIKIGDKLEVSTPSNIPGASPGTI